MHRWWKESCRYLTTKENKHRQHEVWVTFYTFSSKLQSVPDLMCVVSCCLTKDSLSDSERHETAAAAGQSGPINQSTSSSSPGPGERAPPFVGALPPAEEGKVSFSCQPWRPVEKCLLFVFLNCWGEMHSFKRLTPRLIFVIVDIKTRSYSLNSSLGLLRTLCFHFAYFDTFQLLLSQLYRFHHNYSIQRSIRDIIMSTSNPGFRLRSRVVSTMTVVFLL